MVVNRLQTLLFVVILPVGLGLGCSRATCPELTGPVPDQVADAEGRVVAEPGDDVAFVYDPTELREFELLLEDEDLATLDADPMAEEYVPGTLVFDGVEYGPVGVRYKGSYGAWVGCTEESTEDNPLGMGGAKTCPKLNLKVSFNEYDDDGRFFGVKKLLFHAMNHDPSLMRERMAYGLFREMGVPSPRAVHVRLAVNGEYQGVFLNVEYIDGRFTRSRFEDGEGNLYKEVWPTSSNLQPEVTEARLLEHLRTNEDEDPSVAKMLEFGAAAQHDDGDTRAAALAAWLSIGNTMRYIAVDRTIRADDGPFHWYCDGGVCDNHNFYFYEEADADRVWLIPWDLDNAFVVIREQGLNADTFVTVVDEWDDHTVYCRARAGALSPQMTQMPPSCDPLINGLGCHYHGAYDDALDELLAGPFSESAVEEKLADWEVQIEDAVAEASAADGDQLTPDDWQAGITELRERTEILRDQATGGSTSGCALAGGRQPASPVAAVVVLGLLGAAVSTGTRRRCRRRTSRAR